MPGHTQSSFAREAGTSQAAVSKALRAGRLVAGDDGRLDPAAPPNARWLDLHRAGLDGRGHAIKPGLVVLPGAKSRSMNETGEPPPTEEAEKVYRVPEELPELEALFAASELEWGRDYLSGVLEPSGPPAPRLFDVWEGLRFDPGPAHELVDVLFNGHNKPFCLTVIFVEALRQKVAEQLELIRASQAQAVKALRDELAQALDRIAALARKVVQLEDEAAAREGMTSPGSDDLVDALARVERDGLETRGAVTELMSRIVPLLAKLAGE